MGSIGLDVLEIDRLERALERRPRLAARLFTEGELRYANARRRPGRHLAARFCAKEAVAKALELEAWSPHDVEVTGEGGAPGVELRGSARKRARELGVRASISLTHAREVAAAAAILEPLGPSE